MSVAILFVSFGAETEAVAQAAPDGDASHGKGLFQQSCAVCHADSTGPGNAEIEKQGPSLVGVMGRRAGAGTHFNYTKALSDSGMTWDSASLDHFLTDPGAAVPGTSMPISVPTAADRLDLIAYLSTLKFPEQAAPAPAPAPVALSSAPAPMIGGMPARGIRITSRCRTCPLPSARARRETARKWSSRRGCELSVPAGFTVRQFASGLENPRVLRVAPNGDIFLAETGRNQHPRLARGGWGGRALGEPDFRRQSRPSLRHRLLPAGQDPQWIYVANNNSVVRLPYHNGDLKATGPAEVIVPKLTESSGGHSTRDVAFSRDGKRMFISVGSGSNVAESMSKKNPEEIKPGRRNTGMGAAWDAETNRADILVTDPEGHAPLHTFATGIRNGVGIAVDPTTGDLWTSTNERDGLGDDLVPDYITRVKEGGYYGWPWYYMGNHEDPRHAGERPDLADQAIVPDVLLQAHSASLEMTFYPDAKGPAAFPAEYQGDVFAAFHGSWNRNTRTGYKVVRVRFQPLDAACFRTSPITSRCTSPATTATRTRGCN